MKTPSKGPLIAFRIGDRRYPLFDGMGAALYGARWNSQGVHVIYAALSYAGALLEKLAQSGRVGCIPTTHQSIKIQIPSSVDVEEVTPDEVPNWNAPTLIASKAYGDAWLQEKRTVVLIVPSILAAEEKNVLFNPAHPDFPLITASEPEDVVWDPRLFHS